MQFNPTPSCHVCKSSRLRIRAELRGKDDQVYHALQCEECGLVAADPMPSPELSRLREIYSKEYYDTAWCDGGQGYLDKAKVAFMAQEARLQRLEISRLTGIEQGAILDIGCSDGRYLQEFQSAGWRVAGLEISEYAARLAQERLAGAPIYTCLLEEVELEPEQFNVIRLKHCIEHIHQPRELLLNAGTLLSKGGYVVLDTDNAEGLRSRLENTIRSMFGRTLTRSIVRGLTGKDLDTRYGRLSPPIHLYTFNLENLTRLLAESGLRVDYALRPAQGHPIWFPQMHRYRCNPVEALFRLVDDLGGRFDRGEALVVFARKV